VYGKVEEIIVLVEEVIVLLQNFARNTDPRTEFYTVFTHHHAVGGMPPHLLQVFA
jgi:hypothetical protein